MSVNSVLLDLRSPSSDWDRARSEIAAADFIGVDIETQDEARHQGLNTFNNGNRHVFDHRRTEITGISFHAQGSDTAWYVNTGHADVANRVPRERAIELIEARRPGAVFLAHNAPFELVMIEQCWSIRLEDVVCTMQMAVSSHGPDEYDPAAFAAAELTGFRKFVPAVLEAFRNYDPNHITEEQQELLGKFCAKESGAAHSYNGFVKEIALGYGLKKLVKSLFGVTTITYQELLKAHGATHMGQLTGEQVCAYGADDSYWAVKVFERLLERTPGSVKTFFEQEHPMVRHYANVWRDGLKLNLGGVYEERAREREEMAGVLRRMKLAVRALLPFDPEPHAGLSEKDAGWYPKHFQAKRKLIETWALSEDSDDTLTQCRQIRGPVSTAWSTELGMPEPTGPNLSYYFEMRVILYDLLRNKLIVESGKVQSDDTARGRLTARAEKAGDAKAIEVFACYRELAGIEQRLKLFLTPYTQLMDPETQRVYPSLTSMLATRRMAMSFPNATQLTKRGRGAYIRNFYEADDKDHVVVSADWSGVELVLIGEESGDPEFAKVFGQLPHGDLHSGTAVQLLRVATLPELTVPEFKGFKQGLNPNGHILLDTSGGPLTPEAYYKFARTELGKSHGNFSYWFSGALSSAMGFLGWTTEQMWQAVENFRSLYPVAEAWRVQQGLDAAAQGFVQLKDGHTRTRFETTPEWARQMRRKFADLSHAEAMTDYANLAIKRTQSRARNQVVNSKIQGTCATLAKRSIVEVDARHKEAGWGSRVRFMFAVHDELVYSVHKDVAMEFIPVLRRSMCNHPSIVSKLKLDCAVSLGKTFGRQIELDEASPIDNVIPVDFRGKKLPDELVWDVIKYAVAA